MHVLLPVVLMPDAARRSLASRIGGDRGEAEESVTAEIMEAKISSLSPMGGEWTAGVPLIIP